MKYLNFSNENMASSTFYTKCINLSYIPAQVFENTNVACATSSPLYVIISADVKILVFKEKSFELFWDINIDAPTVSVSLSEDSSFLLVAGKSGTLNIFSIPLKKLIWSCECKNYISSEELCYIKEAFLNIDKLGHLVVYSYLETNTILKFTDISVVDSSKTIEDETSSKAAKFEELDLTAFYSGSENFTVFQMFRHKSLMGFIVKPESHTQQLSHYFSVEEALDGAVKADWNWNLQKLKFPEFYEFSEISDVQKVVNTRDGRHIFILHEKRFITIACSFTHAFLSGWEIEEKNYNIVNFTLHETINSNSSFVLDCGIGLLIESRNEAYAFKFEIRKFPSFQIVHSIQLSNYVQLIDNMPNQDFWYLLEGEVSTNKSEFYLMAVEMDCS